MSWLRSARVLSVSSIRGYRSMLSAVFRFHLPSLSSDPVLRDLLRSFKLSLAERILRPPAWDLSRVLRFLNSSHFEPLSQASLHALSQKTLFLLALATAKRVGALQALSFMVTFVGLDACLSYVLQFVAKSESLTRSIPSWLSPCLTLRLVLITTFFCALCGPSAFTLTGLGLCLLYAIAFLCRLVALLALCPRMLFRSFCAM